MFSFSKKLTAIILAVALSIPCMSAYAANSTATKYAQVFATSSVAKGRESNPATGSKSWTYLPLHNPESINALGSATTIAVTVNTTRMPKYVQIQYSKNKTFKSGVKTLKLKNKKYSPVQSTYRIEGEWTGSEKNARYSISYIESTIPGSNRSMPCAFSYKTQEMKKGLATKAAADKLINSKAYIDKSRTNMKASGTYKITGVKSPKNYYVRIRNVFEFNGKTYYSAWALVKVK